MSELELQLKYGPHHAELSELALKLIRKQQALLEQCREAMEAQLVDAWCDCDACNLTRDALAALKGEGDE